MFKIDTDMGLALLGIVAILLILGTILLVAKQLGIQTYNVLQVGSPCHKTFCAQRWPAQEIGRDWERGIAYCQCTDGSIRQRPLFA